MCRQCAGAFRFPRENDPPEDALRQGAAHLFYSEPAPVKRSGDTGADTGQPASPRCASADDVPPPLPPSS